MKSKPARTPPSIEAVKPYGLPEKLRGTFRTKSDGDLRVPLVMPPELVTWMLDYDPAEFELLGPGSEMLRALRCYNIRGLRRGSQGSEEFHRIRKEIVVCLGGRFRFRCEDVWGRKKDFEISEGNGLLLPEFLWHTYECLEDGELFVMANTGYVPGDPRLQDTYYERSSFDAIQREFKPTQKARS